MVHFNTPFYMKDTPVSKPKTARRRTLRYSERKSKNTKKSYVHNSDSTNNTILSGSLVDDITSVEHSNIQYSVDQSLIISNKESIINNESNKTVKIYQNINNTNNSNCSNNSSNINDIKDFRINNIGNIQADVLQNTKTSKIKKKVQEESKKRRKRSLRADKDHENNLIARNRLVKSYIKSLKMFVDNINDEDLVSHVRYVTEE
ncbi:hypothetical protein EDEG_03329 [Edhazardia aedis USNM 41457]|uniref:Uncharacterized protein n=1 Tax=Edhazardia aedis (strain USNM 41457) TaxID=1003232 RepID=J9D315_EDHAE|nr:hypothetical protein EDEG_03329 [Edhazardia aedis USNM 41457]|eukprot:EJW02211.1 hypothetical protein EDEG_03329 [Edhazardia aedis USNM 41457]